MGDGVEGMEELAGGTSENVRGWGQATLGVRA